MHIKTIRRNNNGFTLVELMITVAILSILATVVAPGFSDFISRNSVASEANRLASLLRFARSEAIQHQDSVRVCQADAARTACGNGNNGLLVISASGVVLQITPPVSASVAMPVISVTFDRDGSTRNPGVITVRDGNGNTSNSAVITLNGAGLIRH